MSKIVPFLLVLTLALATAFPVSAADAATSATNPSPQSAQPTSPQPAYNEAPRVLVVYDSLAVGTAKAGNVETLQLLLSSFGAEVTTLSLEGYEKGTVQRYDRLVTIRNVPDAGVASADFASDVAVFADAMLHIGAMPPDKLREKLDLQIEAAGNEPAMLSVGALSERTAEDGERMRIVGARSEKSYGKMETDGRAAEPYGVRSGEFAFASYLGQSDLSQLAMAALLKDWFAGVSNSMQPGSDTPTGAVENANATSATKATSARDVTNAAPRTYLLFEGVTPFSDLDRLVRLADRLYEAGIPFLVGAAPIFKNASDPAALRYMETLKAVQADNGTVLIQAPVPAAGIRAQPGTLKRGMTAFLDQVAKAGVAPLGIAAETYWAYDSLYRDEGLSFFDSAVLLPNERPQYEQQTNFSPAFASAPYALSAERLFAFKHAGKVWDPFPMDTVVVFPFFDDKAAQDEALATLEASWIPFSDFKSGLHTTRTASTTLQSADGMLFRNGQPLDLSEPPKAVDGSFADRKQTAKKSFAGLFSVQNKIFIALIGSTLLLFIFFLVLGYRLYRQKYFRAGRGGL